MPKARPTRARWWSQRARKAVTGWDLRRSRVPASVPRRGSSLCGGKAEAGSLGAGCRGWHAIGFRGRGERRRAFPALPGGRRGDARMNRFVVCDPARCIGCGACLVTCSESHRKRWMRPAARLSLAKTRTVTAAVTCHQCEGAPCMAVCPEAAISLGARPRAHRRGTLHRLPSVRAGLPVRRRVPVGALRRAGQGHAVRPRVVLALVGARCGRRRRAAMRRWSRATCARRCPAGRGASCRAPRRRSRWWTNAR